jgi:uncharacterized Tic20 family protein
MTTPTQSDPPLLDSNDKLWVVCCHLSLFLGVGLLLPLIVYLVKKSEPGPVAAHAAEVLNFHISLYIYSLVSFVLICVFIGFFLLVGIWLISLVCAIVGAIKASEGNFYRYPLTIRFIK